MNLDDVTLVILAASGCVTLLLAQVSEVLSRLPQIIRVWRQLRQELNGGAVSDPPNVSVSRTEPGVGGEGEADGTAAGGTG